MEEGGGIVLWAENVLKTSWKCSPLALDRG